MTQPHRYGDAGQAFPIYITVVAGLLFLAFAYFAVGQAAVNRNGAQTAADAAALAAAQDTRDKLAGEWGENILDPTKWQDIFNGNGVVFDGCARAAQLARANNANLNGCNPQPWSLRYEVDVQTQKPVGRSVVPATEHKRSKASAVAVIKPLCTFNLPDAETDEKVLPQLNCKDRNWKLDPEDLADLPQPQHLFDVHLTD